MILPKSIADRIGQFTGRTWLLPKLLEWWKGSDSRIFLLTGGPGTGKSMILAWLAGFAPDPPDSITRERLGCVRAAIKGAHFCQAESRNFTPRAFAESMATQLTGRVTGFAKALETTLGKQVQLTVIQTINTIAAGGTATGVQIDLGSLTDDLSFDQAFIGPLKQLYESGYKEPMLLLVDALDEALNHTGMTLPELLSRLTDLPAGVRILATTRDEPRVLKFFRNVKTFDLIKDADPDIDDVRDYATQRLTKIVAVNDSKRTAFAERLSKQADGVFLYAAMVLDVLLQRAIVEFPDLATYPLPKGLSGLYHDFLNRELGENEQLWSDRYRPLLGVVAVAQGEGLTAEQLASIIKRDREQVGDMLRRCKQYLSGNLPGGPFRLFHKSFVDFLLDAKENVHYHIDSASMHQMIANLYYDTYFGKWSSSDMYGVYHLPFHLAGSNGAEKIAKLLTDFDWLRTKLERTDLESLIHDFDFVQGGRVPNRIKAAIRQSAFALTRDPSQIGSQLYVRLALQDGLYEFREQILRSYSHEAWLRPSSLSLIPAGGEEIAALAGHQEIILDVALTEDGQVAVSASRDNTVRIWDLHSGLPLNILTGHDKDVTAVAVSHNARVVVSGAEDGLIKVWDPQTDSALRTLHGHREAVTSIAISKDGNTAVSGCSDGSLKVWDSQSGKLLHELVGHENSITGVALTADTSRAISGSVDGSIRVWDLTTAKAIRILEHGKNEVWAGDTAVTCLAVTSDGKFAVSGSNRGTLRLWQLDSGTELHRFEKAHGRRIHCVAVTADGLVAFSGSKDSHLKVWDLRLKHQLRELGAGIWYPSAAAVSADGHIAVSGEGTTLKVWDLTVTSNTARDMCHWGGVDAVAISNDASLAVSCGNVSRTLLEWDGASVPTKTLVLPQPMDVVSLGLRFALLKSFIGPLQIWDIKRDKRTAIVRQSPGVDMTWPELFALEDSGPRWKRFAFGIALYRSRPKQKPKPRSIYEHKYDAVNDVTAGAVRFDGRIAIIGYADGSICVFGMSPPLLIGTLTGHTGRINDLALSRDGRIAVSVSRDETLRIWDLQAGKQCGVISVFCTSVAVTADGNFALTGSQPMRVWDLRTGNGISTLAGDGRWVHRVWISPDGNLAFSCSTEQCCTAWDLKTCKSVASFYADGEITSCAGTPDCGTVIAGDKLGYVHFLHLQRGGVTITE